MNYKRITAGAMVALAGLAFTAVIAANPFATQANSQPTNEDTLLPVTEHLQATEDTDAEAYIGIAISPVSAAETEELGIEGGAKVVGVIESGPADGVLEEGDVIIGIGDETVDSTSNVMDIVRTSEPGDTVAVTVRRGDDTIVLSVTLGEREVGQRSFVRRFAQALPGQHGREDVGQMLMGQAMRLLDRFARGEMIIADEDGNYQTHRAAVGTVVTSDTVTGTLTLQPKDGSDPIDYTITDETQVNMNRTGDISALNTEDTTLVVDVNGEAKIIHQGDMPEPNKSHGSGVGRRRHAGFSGMIGRSSHDQRSGQNRPNINVFRPFGPQNAQSGFPFFGQGSFGPDSLDNLPSEIQEIFERMEANGFDRGAFHELVCGREVLDQLPNGIEIRCESSDRDGSTPISGDAL